MTALPSTRMRSTLAIISAALAAGGCAAILGIEDQHLRPDASANEAGGVPDATVVDAGVSRYRSAVIEDAPVVYVRFGEGAGPTAVDEMGHIAGTYPGSGVTFGVQGALANDPDTAVTLAGTSTIHFSQGVDFVDFAPFSLEVWVKSNGSDYGFIVDHEAYPRRGWSLFINQKNLVFERWGADQAHTSTVAENALVDANWHHVVGTWDGNVHRLYVDGELAASTAASFNALTRIAGGWTVGGQNCECTVNFFTGGLDELAIYDHPLLPERIQAHLRAARP